MCALSNGRSVESTMGFTALDGLPMGTRPGQIDPGVVLYLMSEKSMSAEAIQKFLYNDCGLKGLSGISNDMRVLETGDEPGAKLAIDYFVYRIGLYAGMLAAALGGVDAFVFTAGIGENSAGIRARIAEKLGWLGAAGYKCECWRKAGHLAPSKPPETLRDSHRRRTYDCRAHARCYSGRSAAENRLARRPA